MKTNIQANRLTRRMAQWALYLSFSVLAVRPALAEPKHADEVGGDGFKKHELLPPPFRAIGLSAERQAIRDKAKSHVLEAVNKCLREDEINEINMPTMVWPANEAAADGIRMALSRYLEECLINASQKAAHEVGGANVFSCQNTQKSSHEKHFLEEGISRREK